MRVAYLVNQYPMVSLTFIRREIRALEAHGVSVDRFSIRRWHDTLVDPADQEEFAKTRCILSAGITGLTLAVFTAALTRPRLFFGTLWLAFRVTQGSDRSLLIHLAYFAEACVLLRWLQQVGSEHLHAHFATNPAEVAMFCHQLGGPPYSFTVHGPEEFDRAVGLGYAEKVRRAKFVAAISEFCRSQIFRWCDWQDWPRIKIVRCGVEDSLLRQPPPAFTHSARLVCVGRLCEQKGHLTLLQAAAQLKSEGLSFEVVLVGDGELRAELERAIEILRLEKHVRITGWIDNQQVVEELVAAVGLVLPSFAEGLPVVIMEAMALGRPVISTCVAGIPELVQPGVNGWLVTPGNASALAEAMRALLHADQAQLHEMGTHGRAAVEMQHSAYAEALKLVRYFTASGQD
jgi:colanic acid/amylovoran biosynthesis glycosyltransferase